MKVIKQMASWQAIRLSVTGDIGFVPTMGALHPGHVSLLRESVAHNAVTVLSIYVNPTQFNDPKDLDNYPDTLARDLEVAEASGVDYVILPRYEDLYADGFRYQVTETEFSKQLCGMNRPGHFTGVLTVVMKLLNLVSPHRAYFGKKDYQQYRLVREMVETFFMPVEIIGCETVRESDGLAMSSRNQLLQTSARKQAAHFYEIIQRLDSDDVVKTMLQASGFSVDYVETRQGRRFAAIETAGKTPGQTVRLIDNVALGCGNDQQTDWRYFDTSESMGTTG